MGEKRFHLVCYDISDDDDRTWVAGQLEAVGHRVQESVFECHLDHRELNELSGRLRERIAPPDEVAFYPLCRTCRERMISTKGRRAEGMPGWLVV